MAILRRLGGGTQLTSHRDCHLRWLKAYDMSKCFGAAFVAIVLCCAIGCTVPAETRRSTMNLADLSETVEFPAFAPPRSGKIGQIRLGIASADTVASPGVRSGIRHVIQANLSDVLSKSENFRLADRTVANEVAAEWDLAKRGIGAAGSTPEFGQVMIPEYILKPKPRSR